MRQGKIKTEISNSVIHNNLVLSLYIYIFIYQPVNLHDRNILKEDDRLLICGCQVTLLRIHVFYFIRPVK